MTVRIPNRDVLSQIAHGNQQAIRFFEDISAQFGALEPGGIGVVSGVTLGADVANSLADTLTDTGLAFPVVAGRGYWFRASVSFTADATSTGSRWSVSGPPAPVRLSYMSSYSLTGTTRTINEGLSAYDLPSAASLTSASAGANTAVVEGHIEPSASGLVAVRFASEVAGSAITAKRGSILQWARTI